MKSLIFFKILLFIVYSACTNSDDQRTNLVTSSTDGWKEVIEFSNLDPDILEEIKKDFIKDWNVEVYYSAIPQGKLIKRKFRTDEVLVKRMFENKLNHKFIGIHFKLKPKPEVLKASSFYFGCEMDGDECHQIPLYWYYLNEKSEVLSIVKAKRLVEYSDKNADGVTDFIFEYEEYSGYLDDRNTQLQKGSRVWDGKLKKIVEEMN